MTGLLLALALIAAPQDTTTVQVRVPPPNIIVNGDSTYIFVEVGTDSLAIAVERLRAALSSSLATETGPRVGRSWRAWEGAFILGAGLFLGYRIWGKRVEVTNTEIRIIDEDDHEHPPHEHPTSDPWIPPGHRKPKRGGGGE